MNATIQNISNEGESVKVFVVFSNGQEKVYYLNIDQANEENITNLIKTDIEEFNRQEEETKLREGRALQVAELLSDLQGKVIE
jgi:hypothetical protein